MSQITHEESNKLAEIESQQASSLINRPRQLIHFVLSAIPTVLVLGALAGIATFGHYNGWKLPKFTSATEEGTASNEWCPEHGVPEEECIECIPSLLAADADLGWCKEHGVHQCPHCHPEVAQLKEPPNPDTLSAKTISWALGTKERQENNLGCTLYRSRVQFASIEAVRKAGVDVEPAETQRITESVVANGEFTYDETRVARVSTRADGIVYQVKRNIGDRVQQGELLALVDSSEVGNAKAAMLDAMAKTDYQSKTVSRIAPLARSQAVSGARLLEEESLLKQSQIQLNRAAQTLANLGMQVDVKALNQLQETARWDAVRFLGVPDGVAKDLTNSTASNNLIPILAPLDGIITQREIVQGEVVSKTDMLFEVVDTSVLWLRLRVSLEDANYLALGKSVKFRPDGSKQVVTSKINWISTNIESATRTLEVRSDIANAVGQYRNETFGSGEVILREAEDAVVVPSEAVQWDGSCFVVFVRDLNYFKEGHPKLFHTRSVRPGVTSNGRTEIIAGLLPGEIVATKGSSVLRSQILKNNLGAGCTCGH